MGSSLAKEKGEKPWGELKYKDMVKAVARGDDKTAKTKLAWLILSGFGNDSVSKAIELLQEQVRDGDADSMWILGLCNEFGIGVAQNKRRAMSLYQQSVRNGSPIGKSLVRNNPNALENGEVQLENLDAIEMEKAFVVAPWTSLISLRCNIGDEGAKRLSEILKLNTRLTKLCLNECRIQAEGARYIGELLKTNTTLNELSLAGDPYNRIGGTFGDEGAKYLSESLRTNSTLTKLELSENGIGEEGTVELCESLMTNTSVTIFSFNRNTLNKEGTKKIGELLSKNSTLTELIVSHCSSFDRDESSCFFESLKSNSTLVALDLSCNRLSDYEIRFLIAALENNTTLTSLNVRNSRTEDAYVFNDLLTINTTLTKMDVGCCINPSRIFNGKWRLGETLINNSTLTQLNMDKSLINGEVMAKISDYLLANTSLTVLSLEGNWVESDGYKFLESLKVNSSLTILNLAFCFLKKPGLKIIAESLMVNSSLTGLNLSVNCIESDEEVGVFFREALKANSTLISLNLGSNHLEDEGAKRVCESLMVNTTLTKLSLEGNNITQDAALWICDFLKGNDSLLFLDLTDNGYKESDAEHLMELMRINTPLTVLLGSTFSPLYVTNINEPLSTETSSDEVNHDANKGTTEKAKPVKAAVKLNLNLEDD